MDLGSKDRNVNGLLHDTHAVLYLISFLQYFMHHNNKNLFRGELKYNLILGEIHPLHVFQYNQQTTYKSNMQKLTEVFYYLLKHSVHLISHFLQTQRLKTLILLQVIPQMTLDCFYLHFV